MMVRTSQRHETVNILRLQNSNLNIQLSRHFAAKCDIGTRLKVFRKTMRVIKMSVIVNIHRFHIEYSLEQKLYPLFEIILLVSS